MSSIYLACTTPTRKRRGHRRSVVTVNVFNREHACGVFACGVLLSSMLAVGCASDLRAAETRGSSAAKEAPHTPVASGSPRSYEVLGKRYNIRASSDGYRERGTASWYGHPFDGRPTSSGEMYDMMEMTAAHPTLPIPTWVEVTNLKNGKRVVVKVNDRGPFVGQRLIDLSYGAATALDMVRDGTTRVEVKALPGPPQKAPTPRVDRNQSSTNQSSTQARERGATPGATASISQPKAPISQPNAPVAKPTAPPVPVSSRADSPQRTVERQSPPLDPQRLFAEAGRFTKRDEALELVDSLKAEGFMNAFVVTEDMRRKSLHRVRVGPLADANEVERMNERLRELGAKRSHSVAMR
jgi:rare lipoprotein A